MIDRNLSIFVQRYKLLDHHQHRILANDRDLILVEEIRRAMYAVLTGLSGALIRSYQNEIEDIDRKLRNAGLHDRLSLMRQRAKLEERKRQAPTEAERMVQEA